MRISDWSSDVCSSDLFYEATGKVDDGAGSATIEAHSFGMFLGLEFPQFTRYPLYCVGFEEGNGPHQLFLGGQYRANPSGGYGIRAGRSEEHTSELQSLMRISYAVFCLQKKKLKTTQRA